MMTLKEEFKSWFYSRCAFYKDMPMKFYKDGEPYFSSQGAECSLRDYLRIKEEMSNIFTCTYIGGGGREYDGGIWQLKETPKTMVFTCIKKSFFEVDRKILKIHKNPEKNKRHCLKDWEDGTYTIYPDQCGVPHIFEPIKPEKIEEIRDVLKNRTTKGEK